MASKSKNVRMEQLRIFEKKLAIRLQQLDQKGIDKEKASKDPLVKSLKSKIRETNARIAAIDKFVQRVQELAKAKAQKLADESMKKEEKAATPVKEKPSEVKHDEAKPKPKKKEEAVDKEPKKKPEPQGEKSVEEPQKPVVKEEAAPKKVKKTAATANEAAPKKAKKQPADDAEAAPKKRAAKKKEE